MAVPMIMTNSTPTPIRRLAEHLNRWAHTTQIRTQSAQTYLRANTQFLLWLQSSNIPSPGQNDVLAYRKLLEKTKKPATVQLYMMALRRFYSWLALTEKSYKNIAADVRIGQVEYVRRREHLTPDQIREVLAAIDRRSERGLRDYALLSLMVIGGLRQNEVVNANVGDFCRGADGGAILRLQSDDRRAERDLAIELPPPAASAILDYLSRRRELGDPTAPLFASTSNNRIQRRLSVRGIYGIVRERLSPVGNNSGAPTVQSLRAAAITLALHSGKPLQEVQRFARHATIAATLAYVGEAALPSQTSGGRAAVAVAEAIFGGGDSPS
jgi:integrase/recombinase XerC